MRDDPDDEMYNAIGKFITMWAATEAALARQVGRLVSTVHDLQAGTSTIHPAILMQATMASLGSSANAALTQMENMTLGRGGEIRKLANTILEIKRKRDVVAHSVLGEFSSERSFLNFGSSRRKNGSSFPYTATDINAWIEHLIQAAQALDEVINEVTKSNWTELQKDRERWLERQNAAAQRSSAQSSRPRNAHQATRPNDPSQG